MSPTWPELILLMAFGPGQGRDPALRGTVHTRELRDDEPRDSVSYVAARGDLARVERADGTPLIIFGADTIWTFSTEPPTAYDRTTASFSWNGAEFVRRKPLSRWEGDDFTRPTGPIVETTFLGRPAYELQLAPPRHKPYPLQMIIDAATGLMLREGNRDFGTVTEWVELEVDAELPDELFSWDGPTQAPPDRAAEREADMAARRRWLASQGIPDLELAIRPELILHIWDGATGAFHASFHASVGGSLLRRPHTDAAWDEVDEMRWPNVIRWTHEGWDWAVATDAQTSAEMEDALRRQLGG